MALRDTWHAASYGVGDDGLTTLKLAGYPSDSLGLILDGWGDARDVEFCGEMILDEEQAAEAPSVTVELQLSGGKAASVAELEALVEMVADSMAVSSDQIKVLAEESLAGNTIR